MGFRIYFRKYMPDGGAGSIDVDEIVCDGYEETGIGVKLFKLEPVPVSELAPCFVLRPRTHFTWWERFTGEDRDPLLSQQLVKVEHVDKSAYCPRRRVHFVTISNRSFDYYKVFPFEGAAP